MPETLTPEPLLADELAACTGLAVSECCGRAILRLEWRTGDAPRLAGAPLPAIGGVVMSDGFSLMRTSPVSALAVSDTLSAGKLADSVADGRTSVVDVSHGFVVLRLRGAAARGLLDGLVPLDLSEKEIRSATLRRTQIASHGVTIHCTGAESFDLYVDRSYAWSLWQCLNRRACG